MNTSTEINALSINKYLWVIGTGYSVLCACNGVQLLRHFIYELPSLISNEDLWASIATHHLEMLYID